MGEARTFEQVLRDPRGRGDVRKMIFEIRDAKGWIVVPPMYLVMNPASLRRSASWLVNRYQTRGAWVEEVYGQNLDEIACDGSTAAFITKNGLLGGLDAVSSEAWRNFEALVSVYRSNGEANMASDGQVVKVGSVVMAYDEGVYEGYFESFSYTEDAERPFVLELSFVFKVLKTIITFVRAVG